MGLLYNESIINFHYSQLVKIAYINWLTENKNHKDFDWEEEKQKALKNQTNATNQKYILSLAKSYMNYCISSLRSDPTSIDLRGRVYCSYRKKYKGMI
jgi:hypothetical protein